MDIILLKLTALFYLLATVSFIVYVFLVRESISKLSPLILTIGFLLHTAAIVVNLFHTGYPNVTEFREALSLSRSTIA
jgi:hypothetical protein